MCTEVNIRMPLLWPEYIKAKVGGYGMRPTRKQAELLLGVDRTDMPDGRRGTIGQLQLIRFFDELAPFTEKEFDQISERLGLVPSIPKPPDMELLHRQIVGHYPGKTELLDMSPAPGKLVLRSGDELERRRNKAKAARRARKRNRAR